MFDLYTLVLIFSMTGTGSISSEQFPGYSLEECREIGGDAIGKDNNKEKSYGNVIVAKFVCIKNPNNGKVVFDGDGESFRIEK